MALPDGAGWRLMAGVGFLAGIGFTLSIFIAGLAFDDPALDDAAKVGILAASALAGALGAAVLGLRLPVSGRVGGEPRTAWSAARR